MASPVKGIEVNRERPLWTGWCGADNCSHQSHHRVTVKPAKKLKKARK